MPTRATLPAAAGSAVAVTIALLAGGSPAAHAQESCQGQPATHVGEPGQDLRTTHGDDVVVTGSAVTVHTLGGDDVVCVTGDQPRTWVHAGSGDDHVSAAQYAGRRVSSDPGRGSDTYVGHPGTDWVDLAPGSAADLDRVRTGAGEDTLWADRRYSGQVRAALGQGRDTLSVSSTPGRIRVDGNQGRDQVRASAPDRLLVRLDDGTLALDGRRAGPLTHFEDVWAWSHRVEVHGNSRPNRIHVLACFADVHGKAGADRVDPEIFYDECEAPTPRMRFSGGQGADSLRGWVGPDRLIGGRGSDVARGGGGRDVCRAERERECEA